MENENYGQLTNLQQNLRTDWKIRVHVSRMWQQINHHTAQIRGLNLIFVDESVSSPNIYLITTLPIQLLNLNCLQTNSIQELMHG